MMKNILLTCMLLLGFAVNMSSQERIVVTGVVTDTNKEPMIGVNISIANMPGLGAITDMNGKFSIKVPPFNRLVFSYIGFENVEVLVKEQRIVNVTMKESSATVMDEVVITGTGAQKKIAVSGAVTNVDVEELKANPSASIADGLAGVVPGVMAMQSSGRPGSVSEFWIRSISTFGASSAALVLVDGFERDLNEVNVEDIASFTVLKDASATAIYGSKGANGVILINTRRGKEGKINISAKVEGFYSQFINVPDFVDGYTYASMANEAKMARNQEPLYSHEELEILRMGLDQDIFPDVDWMDTILKKGTWSQRVSLNMNGGGSIARYYVGASYQNQDGMYKTDESIKKYNTNTGFRKWTYRMNVDIDITKSTLLRVGVSGSLRKQNDPGVGSKAIWTALMGYNPILCPITFSNGRIPANGDDNGDRFNPWTQGTQTGYNESWENNLQTNVTLEQKLDFITKGLRFVGRFGYDTYNSSWIKRYKHPELWKAGRYRENGEVQYTRVVPEMEMVQTSGSTGDRREFFEWELHYDRGFGNHHAGGTLKYNQSSKVFTDKGQIGTDLKNGIARRNQGVAGRVNYNWAYRYFVDFNFGYTGSENFHKDYRFGFFPAVSGAWNIAEEPFLKKVKWINMLKLRYSWGKTGNDNLQENGKDIRFPYLYRISHMLDDNGKSTGGYQFADYLGTSNYIGGMRYSGLASSNVSWEIATKQDLGLDFSFFNDKLTGTIDYFHEHREAIYMKRANLPDIVGVEQQPFGNVGEVTAKGFDGNFALKQKIGNVNLTLRGNMTYSKNKILERDEKNTIYTYTLDAGHRVDQAKGLIALGLFQDYNDIRNSPRQVWGDVMPGDIKYKDVNGDGIVNEKDRVAIGASTRPSVTYGFGLSAKWKGLDMNVHFQGAGKSTFLVEGSTVHMFSSGDGWGNVLKEMADCNRWILGVNEDPNAEYPRLTYGGNSNNYQQSTYWLRNGAYMRWKRLDVGYTFPTGLVNKIHLNTVRVFFVGTNLLTFSKFKLWDPELGNKTGKEYPLSRTFSLGVSVNL